MPNLAFQVNQFVTEEIQKQRLTNRINKSIQEEDLTEFTRVANYICKFIRFEQKVIKMPLIEKLTSNSLEFVGNKMEFSVLSDLYYTDYEPNQFFEKEILNYKCELIKIKYSICNKNNSMQIPKQYYDYGEETIDKQLKFMINWDDLKKKVCGKDALDHLIKLIKSLPEKSRSKMIRYAVLKDFNDPKNYYQLKNIYYCCDVCGNGTGLLSQLEKYLLELQDNTGKYNFQNHDYDLPVEDMILAKSYTLSTKISGILSDKRNVSLATETYSKIGINETIPLKIADAVVCDKDWYQYHNTLYNFNVAPNYGGRAECIYSDYKAVKKPINFYTAVLINFIRIECDLISSVSSLWKEITKNECNVILVSDDSKSFAQTEIEKIIEPLTKNIKNIKIEYSYPDKQFLKPTDDDDGHIQVIVKVTLTSESPNIEFDKGSFNFILRKSKNNNSPKEEDNSYVKENLED